MSKVIIYINKLDWFIKWSIIIYPPRLRFLGGIFMVQPIILLMQIGHFMWFGLGVNPPQTLLNEYS